MRQPISTKRTGQPKPARLLSNLTLENPLWREGDCPLTKTIDVPYQGRILKPKWRKGKCFFQKLFKKISDAKRAAIKRGFPTF
jgi:hypothetical protein